MDRVSNKLREYYKLLSKELFEAVLPFWVEHAIDPCGGINTCIQDDGTLVNRDKYLWSQWRAVWVFSKLYNQGDRSDDWLGLARGIFEFASKSGWDEQAGGWVLRLSGDGAVLDGYESIYVDGFAIYGLTEFAKAKRDGKAINLARKTADSVLQKLQTPHDQIPHYPYPIPAGARVQGLPMIFSLALWELGQLLEESKYKQAALEMSDEIFNNFYRKDRDLVLERIAADSSEYPGALGRAVVPGHVVENMWFQIHIARDNANHARIEDACRLIKRHMEFGWDDKYGGILLGVDADGSQDVGWDYHDAKIWWPHTEAMYALLLAYEYTKESWCLDWYDKVHEYSFSHFPVREYGEWRQKLDRRGNPISDIVALPVKDPFHLPRALIYCLDVLGRMGKHYAA